MKEENGNLWVKNEKGFWVVVTTNGETDSKGRAIMGGGIALQASCRFLSLRKELGELLRRRGNLVFTFPEYKVITFPTKDSPWEKSTLGMIEENTLVLESLQAFLSPLPIYLPRLGCGLGGLKWEDVRPILSRILDDNFVVLHLKDEVQAEGK
jgi:hypothetical protein